MNGPSMSQNTLKQLLILAPDRKRHQEWAINQLLFELCWLQKAFTEDEVQFPLEVPGGDTPSVVFRGPSS